MGEVAEVKENKPKKKQGRKRGYKGEDRCVGVCSSAVTLPSACIFVSPNIQAQQTWQLALMQLKYCQPTLAVK